MVLYLHRRVGGGGDDAGKLCVVDLAGSERLKKSGAIWTMNGWEDASGLPEYEELM